MQILDKQHETLVTRERALLESLMEFLSGFGAPPGDVELLNQTLSDIDEPFLLVVVGEFNAGKSAFINALLGEEVTNEGSLPTTDRVTIFKHSLEPFENESARGVLERGVPAGLLRAISVVDTPGTNAVIREHEELSREFVPRSDLVLFVTSAERPFSESERAYMEVIRDWGKKIVVIVNKMDTLSAEEAVETRKFIEERVHALLGLTPPVFMVSARKGQKAKKMGDRAERSRLMHESGFAGLESYVANLMGEKDLVNLKLRSPLGVAEEFVRRYRHAAQQRGALLEEDTKMVQNLEEQLKNHRDESRRDFEVRLGQIALVMNEINERADAYFEQNSDFSLGGIFGRGGGMEQTFREEVVADTGEAINRGVRELINWLVYRNLKQWRYLVDYIELHRKADLTRRLMGETIADDFGGRRDGLLQSISDDAAGVIESFDSKREADRLANSLQGAVSKTAASEAEAAGLGDSAVELAANGKSDITGTTLAVMVAGLEVGKGRKARSEFRQRTNALRERLDEAVQRQLQAELESSVQQMRETIVPYSNFVGSELRRMKTAESILGKLGGGVESLEDAVPNL